MSVTPWNGSPQLFVPSADLPRVSKVRLEIVPDQLALHGHFARSIADEIQANNQAGCPTRLILPVGPRVNTRSWRASATRNVFLGAACIRSTWTNTVTGKGVLCP